MAATAVKEKPILFSSPMVRAILDGRKTQTRRPVDLSDKNVLSLEQRKIGWTCNPELARVGDVGKMIAALAGKPRDIVSQQISVPARHPNEKMPWEDCGYERVYCPFGGPGDRLWVRETWAQIPEMKPSGYFTDPEWIDRVAWYAADNDKPTWGGKWRPSIHMPRWASRITLEITSVRVERLQAIAETPQGWADIRAEGIACPSHDFSSGACVGYCKALVEKFAETWDSIYGDGAWKLNPFVWVVSFTLIREPRP